MLLRIVNDQFNEGPGGQHRALTFAKILSKWHEVELATPYFLAELDRRPEVPKSLLSNRLVHLVHNSLLLPAKEVFRREPDACMIVLPVPLLRGLTAFVRPWIPTWLDFGDIWYSLDDPRPWINAMNAFLKLLGKSVEMITVPNNFLREKMLRLGLDPRRVEVIHVVPDPNDFSPDAEPAVDFGNRFVVVFAGSITDDFDVDLVVAAAKRLPDFVFLIVGDGPRRGELELKARGLQNVVIRGPVPRNMLPHYLASAHVGIATHKRPYWKPVNEQKIAEYLAAGLPVVSTHPADLLSDCNSYIAKGVDDFVEALAKFAKTDFKDRAKPCTSGLIRRKFVEMTAKLYAISRSLSE